MIKWETVYKIRANEFSEDPDKYAEPDLIYALSDIRQYTQRSMRPSPVKGALARFIGSISSQHYVGPKDAIIRKSTGSDIFCEGIPFSTYTSILASRLFRGVGIYLDTKGPDGLPWIMFHVDIRTKGFNSNSPLIWIVEKIYDSEKSKKVNKYRYPQVVSKYWKLLNNEKFYSSKEYGIKQTQ